MERGSEPFEFDDRRDEPPIPTWEEARRAPEPSPTATPRREVVVSFRTLLTIALSFALFWAVVQAREAVLLVFISLFLALVFQTPTNWMERHWGMHRATSAMLLVFGIIGVLAFLGYLFVSPFVGAVQDLVTDLPNIVERIRQSDIFRQIDKRTDIGTELQSRAEDLAAQASTRIGDVFGVGGKVFSFGLSTVAVVFMTLFLVIELPTISGWIRSLLYPATADRVQTLEFAITRTIGRYALGAVAIAAVAGVVQGSGAWLVGAPFPLALGILAGTLGLVPQVGATFAAVALSLVTLTVGWPQALIMLGICIGYQQLENYVLQPMIQGRAAEISGFLVIASVFIGAALLGVVGALLAVPIAASIQIVVRELTADRRAAVAEARLAVEGPASPTADLEYRARRFRRRLEQLSREAVTRRRSGRAE